MGEGIRNAKVVTLLKQPGDKVELDDPLCEVETDKAVYPIEASFAGTMGEWKTEVDATVDIGQDIGSVLGSGDEVTEQVEAAVDGIVDPAEAKPEPQAAKGNGHRRIARHRTRAHAHHHAPPRPRRAGKFADRRALGWQSAKPAPRSKRAKARSAASPSVMLAWAVVRAMEKHAPFRRVMLEDDSIVEHAEFDLGIAVSLENDRLATAVVTKANTRDWPDFVKRYNETVEETRTGRVDAVNAPIVISSLGAFGVRAAAPIVVPPSVGTLFVGSAHYEMMSNGKKSEPAEVITLSLTFDHRVVNGAGAASFVHDIKEEIEGFKIPNATVSA